jgi:hypothetical protein
MTLDGCRRFGAIEFERHDNHEKTIQLYPGTVRVRELKTDLPTFTEILTQQEQMGFHYQ